MSTKMFKKVIGGLLAASVCVSMLLVPAAAEEDAAAGARIDGTTDEKLWDVISPDETYYVISALNNIEYFNAHKYGWEIYAKMFGVNARFMGPADDNVNDMITQFETALASDPTGICVWGYDPALESCIKKAREAGIPVITYINDVGEARESYVGSSAHELGYSGAKQYAEMIGGEGKVAILTLTGSDSFMERCQGFEDGFAEYPDIEVVAIGDTQADSNTATSVAKDIAVKNPDMNGFVCCDSTGAAGAATALKELGLTGEIDVLGLDRNNDVLAMVKSGEITGTIAQDDVAMDYWALVELITMAHVDIPMSTDNAAAGAITTPSYIYTPVTLITADTVDYYLEANELYATNSF